MIVVDMIYHYLMNVFDHNEQKILYHMIVDLRKKGGNPKNVNIQIKKRYIYIPYLVWG